jgi:hypothetical protein
MSSTYSNEACALESPGPGGSLQWKEHMSGHWSAKGLGGRYDIYPRGVGGYEAYWEQAGTGSQHSLGSYDTIGAAFGACRRHADGERRQTAAAEENGVAADVARKSVASAYGANNIETVSGSGSRYTVTLKDGKRLSVTVNGSTGTVTDPNDGHLVATHTVSEAGECSCQHSHPKSVPTEPCDNTSGMSPWEAIQKNVNHAGLAYVPAIVRDLVKVGYSVSRAKEAIALASEIGRIDLYPDDGFGRLSAADKKLTIPGPEGTNLAYAKIRHGASETVPVIHEALEVGPFATMDRDTKELERGHKLGELRTPQAIYKVVSEALGKESQEVFLVIPMDIHGQALSRPVEVARGQRDRVTIGVSDIMRPVVQTNASRFVVVHNHPSGRAKPSQKDMELTDMIRKETLSDVVFCDHIVVGTKQFFSFTENKLYKV